MKKLIFTILALFLMTTGAIAADNSCTIKKFEDLLKNNELGYASQCIEEIIIRDPSNTYAHFLKGKLCLERGEYTCAKRKFEAGPVKRKYFYQIAGAYRDRAEELVKEGRIGEAKMMYSEAAEREPRVMNEACDVFYYYGNAQFGQRAFSFYDAAREICGAHNEAMGQRILQMAKQVQREERKRFVEEAGKYLDQAAIEVAFPPPTWQTVFKQMYVGEGYGDEDNGYITSAPHFGDEVKYGDKVIITGADFEFKDNGWNKHSGRIESICQNTGNKILGVKAPVGVEVTVEIQRLTE